MTQILLAISNSEYMYWVNYKEVITMAKCGGKKGGKKKGGKRKGCGGGR